MKRFMLFTYSNYYPCGGMSDFHNSFNTLEEIPDHVKNTMNIGWAEEGY